MEIIKELFLRLKLVFSYGPEIHAILEEKREEKRRKEWELKQYNLHLCLAHQQEQNRSHFSPKNCDYCKLEQRLRETGQEVLPPRHSAPPKR